MPKEITLKAAVEALDKTTEALEKVHEKATGKEKEKLELKIEALEKARKELTFICGKSFPLWVPKKKKAKR
jgi:hypothetical protein